MKKRINIKGSLARRVLILAIVILVGPLFIHTLISYRQEYYSKVKSLFESLNIIADSRVLLIDELQESKEDVLGTIQYGMEHHFDESYAVLSEYFKTIVKEIHIFELFYLEYNDVGKLVCRASSTNCEDHNEFLNAKRVTETERSSFLAFDPDTKKPLLYVTQTIYHKGTKQPKGVLMATSEALRVLDGLADLKAPYPLHVSLVTPDGLVLVSSKEGLDRKRLTSDVEDDDDVELERLKHIAHAYELRHGDDTFLAVQIPVHRLGLNLLLDVSEKTIRDVQVRDYFIHITLLVFLVVIVGGTLVYLLTLRLARPLKQLLTVMDRVKSGEEKVRFKKDFLGFEINILGQHLNHMIESVIKHQKALTNERVEKEVYSQELAIGHEIQERILQIPKTHYQTLQVIPFYQSAKEVGGDYYDVFPLSENKLLISIADAAGKGISACLFSLNLRSMIRSFAIELSLDKAIEKANRLFALDAKDSGMFVTAFIGIYHIDTKKLEYINAGHLPPLLKRKERVSELKGRDLGIGLVENHAYKIHRAELKEDDLLLLYTDGVIEMTNPEGEFFGKDKLVQLIKKMKTNDPEKISKVLSDEVMKFSDETSQDDDITTLLIKA